MKKLIFIILFLLVTFTTFSEEMMFRIYGIDSQVTQKYEGLFEVPKFEYMGGGLVGDYVYVVTLITTIGDEDYYCVGIITTHWFAKAVERGGYLTPTVYNENQVNLSYKSVRLIKVPFKQ